MPATVAATTAAERRALVAQEQERRRLEQCMLSAAGLLCRSCHEFEAREDALCRVCLGIRRRHAETRTREHDEMATYRVTASAAGVVVGAEVTRVRGGGYGTVVEVGGNYVRVMWRQHEPVTCPSWCTRRHNRTYVKTLTTLAVRGEPGA